MIVEAQGAALVGSALLLGAFLLTHRRYPSDFSLFWVAGWTVYTIRFVFDLAISTVGTTYLLQVGVNEAVATSAVLLLVAVDRLLETDRTDDRLFVGLWALLSAWIVVVPLLTTNFVLLHTPLYVAFGIIQLVTAYLFYQYLGGQGFLSTPLIVGALTIWGLHKFDYPILRPIEWLAPYGYILGAVLAFTTGLGVMLFLVEDAEKTAREERAVAEQRYEEYQDLFHGLTDPVYIHDSEGNFLQVNDTAVEMLGYSEDELLSMTPRDIVAEEYEAVIDDRIDHAASEGSVTFRSAHETVDGEVIPVAVHAGHITYRGEEVILAVARDISDLEKRERELDRYHQAVEGSTDALSAVDRERQFFFANPVYREIHGIDEDTSIRGRPLADVLDADTWEQIQPRLDRAMDGETVEFEMTRTDSEGTERVFDIRYFPIESGDGTIFGVGASMRDITADRSRTDAIRQLSEYRRVISAVNHQLVRADSTQELLPEVVDTLSSSDQFGCAYLAVVDDDGEPDSLASSDPGMSESSVLDFHTQSYLERVFEAGSLQMQDVTQEPFTHHEEDEPSHAGVAIAITYEEEELGVLTVHVPPGEELEEVGFRMLGQLADDLGLFLHSQSLEQELRTFKEIAERIDDPVMLQSLDGTFEVVNEALGTYADEDPASLIGEDEFAFMDEDAASTIQEMKERVHEMEEPIRYEVRPTLPHKGERIFSTIRYPHYDDGELDGTMAIGRDVTDLKERERQLRVMDRVLRHNVNNNMTVVEGYAETIREMVDDPVVSSYASKITENSNALVATVQKEREISKLLSDPPPKGTFDLVPVVESAIEAVRETEPEAHITSDLPAECRVTATQAMGQAIEELVRNAVRHSDEAQPSVEVHVAEGTEYVRIAVRDNGPGIPTMEQRVLTGEAEIEPLYHGSGLGLWLVNLIVQHSDGHLGFDENEPRGSVVTVELPRS